MLQKISFVLLLSLFFNVLNAQEVMTPELLWSLGRVSPIGLSKDGKTAYYKVSYIDALQGGKSSQVYSVAVDGSSKPNKLVDATGLVPDKNISPDGKYMLSVADVKLKPVTGKDHYPDLKESNVLIYDNLNYRHWDEWEDGAFSHLFLHELKEGKKQAGKDLMEGEPYDCPQKPFGGEEDYTWSPDSKLVVYVTKKKYGTEYAISTNTDIYAYSVADGKTTNLTEGRMGYDIHPKYSIKGELAFLSMRRDGYEADKNDIIIRNGNKLTNLTKDWDGTVNDFVWGPEGKKIYFDAPVKGTVQLFEITLGDKPKIRQVTDGDFNIAGIVGVTAKHLVVTRTDMNHAAELYNVEIASGKMKQLSFTNEEVYKKITLSKVEKRMIVSSDGLQMLTWVIYPPNFDPKKSYPTLLYCQGGPQSALSQFYSFRWNFQLMAAQGYIVVAPNRRGMPGHGVRWNEEISGDWGGQSMRDYLAAIDALAKEPYVDKSRLGCIGASYGGYSAFYLAGIHENRFKTFIAHAGIFNTKSMYGTTEEVFFSNWDMGGAYWEKDKEAAQNTYTKFNPIEMVEKWTSPILIIHGEKDYRVPLSQSMEAFQAAQLRGIKSKLVVFPDENHWILNPQNALVWQREFFKWLKETL